MSWVSNFTCQTASNYLASYNVLFLPLPHTCTGYTYFDFIPLHQFQASIKHQFKLHFLTELYARAAQVKTP